MELPEGVCDVPPDLAQRQRQIQRAFLQVLSGGGYLEVKTPGFELYELLRRGFIAEETMYKFTDHRGRICLAAGFYSVCTAPGREPVGGRGVTLETMLHGRYIGLNSLDQESCTNTHRWGRNSRCPWANG